MIPSNSWNWDNVKEGFWEKASEDVYYFLHRWKAEGLLNILDLGCGMGRHSVLLAEHGFSVTGYDLSESGLKKLKKLAADKKLSIRTRLGDMQELPFKDEEFDCILAYHSMYHTDSPGMKKVINEIDRVLKKSGEIYVTFISKNAYSFTAPDCEKVDENVRLKEEEEGNVLPHYFVNAEDIKNLLSGFSIIRIRQVEDMWEDKSSWHYFVHAKKL